LNRKIVKRFKIVGGITDFAMPAKAEPFDIVFDGVDKLLALLRWIGVIESEIAVPVVFRSHREIQANRLGMPNVKIAIGLRWKAGVHAPAMFPVLQVMRDERADEIGWRCGSGVGSAGLGRVIHKFRTLLLLSAGMTGKVATASTDRGMRTSLLMPSPARCRFRAHMTKTFGADTVTVEILFMAYSKNPFQYLQL